MTPPKGYVLYRLSLSRGWAPRPAYHDFLVGHDDKALRARADAWLEEQVVVRARACEIAADRWQVAGYVVRIGRDLHGAFNPSRSLWVAKRGAEILLRWNLCPVGFRWRRNHPVQISRCRSRRSITSVRPKFRPMRA